MVRWVRSRTVPNIDLIGLVVRRCSQYYADDNRFTPPRKQVTLSIGFTEGGGNLKKVLKRYIDNGGALALTFAPYLPTMGSGRTLANDPKFIKGLKEAEKNRLWSRRRMNVSKSSISDPLVKWAKRYGFALPLSFLVIADSFLHSGSMLRFLLVKIPEKRPKDGGDERLGFTLISKPTANGLRGIKRDFCETRSTASNATSARLPAIIGCWTSHRLS